MHKQPDTPDIERFLIAGTDRETSAWYRALASDDAKASSALGALFEDEVVIVDTETTGLDPARCSLIEIAAVRLRGPEVVDTFETFVDPGVPIPAEIVELTGIRAADVAGAPDPKEAARRFAAFAGDAPLVAHNAPFDRAFLVRQAPLGSLKGPWLDTFALAQIVLPRFTSHRLADLAAAFAAHAPAHRALDDVLALADVWRALLAGVAAMPAGLAGFLAELSPGTDWPLRAVFRRAADSASGGASHAGFSLKAARRARVQNDSVIARYDADDVPLYGVGDEEVRSAFSAEGAAGSMYPAYEQRDEQLAMALEVNAALRDESFAALEAGTGVGKSVAYLLPLALFARENAVVTGVATKTNALMDQLVYHELPRLSQALGGVSYVALKGYDHYPCLRKLERLVREDGLGADVIRMAAMLLHYTAQTTWGDLDALNLHWAGLPRHAVQASAQDCLKRRCPFYPRWCYLHGARRAANAADIVVTNHALLFRDVQMDNGILPPIRHWVVDEAHAVESEARKQLSHAFAARELDAVLSRLAGSAHGIIANVRRRASELEGGNLLYGVTADADARIGQIRSLAASFFSQVKELAQDPAAGAGRGAASGARGGTRRGAGRGAGAGGYDRVTLWLGPQLRASARWELVAGTGHTLAERLDGLVKRLRDLMSTMEEFEGAFPSQQADLANATASLAEMLAALTLVVQGEDERYVYAAELSRDPERTAEVLSAARLDVGEALAESFFPSVKSAVFTSATLSTGDAKNPFGHFLQTSGLSRVDPERVRARQLESSYDFEHNMTVLLPKDMPEPTAPGYHAALEQLLLSVHRAMGGAVLTLFTNRRDMENMYRALKGKLADDGIELIAQMRGTSVKSLRDRFLAEEGVSLFALKSFWEGFDAPGDTLKCVVIPKLPFGRPTDPIARERELRDGRAAWARYSLPEAIIDLKQAAGRLIRGKDDSGWLVLADARLQTKGYGKRFLRALPTSDIRVMGCDEIAQVLREGR